MMDFNNNITIDSDRLSLQVFSLKDITAKYIKSLNNKEIMRFTEARHRAWDESEIQKFVISAAKNVESILFGVFLKKDNRHIGNIRLFNFHKIHLRAELSFLFYDKDEWGKGYATEAIRAILSYSFEDIGLHRVYADYYEPNLASAKVFSKLGFEIEGVYKKHFWFEGRFVDSIRVAKLKDDC